ncbi:DNA-3-methyladenine glycosylase family protein [Amycolatopsis acidiphila]|uniref:DNA-3-methyladenine glycosylase family protein n=1 Tax=Amycolatopsis acidiphila TaxID=715473 RepID=UPI0027E40A35|nr:hypothetical protein [Amycolatopsis acidiphila]
MTSTLHQPTELRAEGPFDLTASGRFLEWFTPGARPDAAGEPGLLRLAFPVEGSWEHAGVLIRQRAPGRVEVSVAVGEEVAAAAVRQVRRILSLDVDGSGFSAIGQADPVVGELQARYPGLRQVLFHSPYEAACWTIITNRIRMPQAARIKQRIAERYGELVEVDGRQLASFPAPEALQAIEQPLGLPEVKIERLRAIARAAQEGVLDAESLRALEPDEALRQLQRLPGIRPVLGPADSRPWRWSSRCVSRQRRTPSRRDAGALRPPRSESRSPCRGRRPLASLSKLGGPTAAHPPGGPPGVVSPGGRASTRIGGGVPAGGPRAQGAVWRAIPGARIGARCTCR